MVPERISSEINCLQETFSNAFREELHLAALCFLKNFKTFPCVHDKDIGTFNLYSVCYQVSKMASFAEFLH